MIRRTSSRKIQDAIAVTTGTKKGRFARYRAQEEPPKMPVATHSHFCADDQSVFSYTTDVNETLSVYAYSIEASSIGGKDDDTDELPVLAQKRYDTTCEIPMTVCLGSRRALNHDAVQSQDLFYDGEDEDCEVEDDEMDDTRRIHHLSSEQHQHQQQHQQQPDLEETDDSSIAGESTEEQAAPVPVPRTKKTVSITAPPTRRSRPNLIDCTFAQSTPVLGTQDASTTTSRDNNKRPSFWSSVRNLIKKKSSNSNSNNWLSFRKSKTRVITVSLKKSQGMKKRTQRRLMMTQQQEPSTEELSSSLYRSERRASF